MFEPTEDYKRIRKGLLTCMVVMLVGTLVALVALCPAITSRFGDETVVFVLAIVFIAGSIIMVVDSEIVLRNYYHSANLRWFKKERKVKTRAKAGDEACS